MYIALDPLILRVERSGYFGFVRVIKIYLWSAEHSWNDYSLFQYREQISNLSRLQNWI